MLGAGRLATLPAGRSLACTHPPDAGAAQLCAAHTVAPPPPAPPYALAQPQPARAHCACCGGHAVPRTTTLQVLELLELVSSGQAPRSVLGQREGQLTQIKRVATLLESSLLHLDTMIALFNDM